MVPNPDQVEDEDLEKTFLNVNNGRQLLHVTFGSILTAKNQNGLWLFRDRIKKVLIDNEEEHYKTLSVHLKHHIESLGIHRKQYPGT
jgi:hypothetical protein